MTDYCTADQVKTRVGVDLGDDKWNEDVNRAIKASSRWIDNHCGRSFGLAGSASGRTFRASSRWKLDLVGNDIASTSGLVVKTDPTGSGTFSETWASSDYELEPLNQLKAGVTWPYTTIRAVETRFFPVAHQRASVQVTATWGWPAIPDDVEEACIIRATALFLRKQSPVGVLDGFGEFGATRVSRFTDPDVAELLRPFRLGTRVAPIA